MSVAPGCHRRPPVRMVPLSRPIGGRRNPRPPTGWRVPNPPVPTPHLQHSRELQPTPLVPHGRLPDTNKQFLCTPPTQRHAKTLSAPRVPLSSWGGEPIVPLKGQSRPPSTPTPGRGGGGGPLKAEGALFFSTHQPRREKWGVTARRGWPSPLVRGWNLQKREAAAPGAGNIK
jgi:hypothetical protein